MYVVSASLNEAALDKAPDGLAYGVPCAFKGCSGFFHPAGGAIGVVLCSPWGFEDLIMRKSWRLLAEAIAKAGYPCIRFDYPGTGDSLGKATDIQTISDWVASIGEAADVLRLKSGVRQFVFIGQSLGATLAVEAARLRGDVVGLQLVAPVVSGRAYARELSVTATVVAEKIAIKLEPTPDEGLSVLGFSMSHAMLESLKRLDLRKIPTLAVDKIIVFDQSDRKAGAEAIDCFRKLGANVVLESVEPFHLMVSDATSIQPLPVNVDRVIEGLRAKAPTALRATPVPSAFPTALVGAGFREEPVRYGPDDSLFGVLCSPLRARRDAPAIILLNRGLNPHIGWRRASVDQARGLALAGIVSLRIDVAGLGESRDDPMRPANLIYSDLLLPDLTAAVDLLAARGFARIGLAGVCSGAYMAFVAAHADPRITDIIAVNSQRFVWNPKESIDDVIRYGLRSVNDYIGDIKSKGALRKIIRSRRRIVPAMTFLAKRSLRNAMVKVPLRLRSSLLRNSMAARVETLFSSLAERGTRVSLIYAENDPGLMELRNYFGERGCDMRFPNVDVTIFPDADHNLTTTRATTWMLDHMIAFASDARKHESGTPSFNAQARARQVCEG